MNDFWFFTGALVLTAAIAGVWCIAKALFERWLNNDWCKHEWDMWSGIDKETMTQYRFCKKCNRSERKCA